MCLVPSPLLAEFGLLNNFHGPLPSLVPSGLVALVHQFFSNFELIGVYGVVDDA